MVSIQFYVFVSDLIGFLIQLITSKNTNSESKQPRLILFWYKESIS